MFSHNHQHFQRKIGDFLNFQEGKLHTGYLLGDYGADTDILRLTLKKFNLNLHSYLFAIFIGSFEFPKELNLVIY